MDDHSSIPARPIDIVSSCNELLWGVLTDNISQAWFVFSVLYLVAQMIANFSIPSFRRGISPVRNPGTRFVIIGALWTAWSLIVLFLLDFNCQLAEYLCK